MQILHLELKCGLMAQVSSFNCENYFVFYSSSSDFTEKLAVRKNRNYKKTTNFDNSRDELDKA